MSVNLAKLDCKDRKNEMPMYVQNLRSNSSGELVSTYDTFQRQSIRSAIPENRASPVSFLSYSFFFSFAFSIYTAREFILKLQIASWLARIGSAITRNSSSHSLGTFLHPRPPRHSRSSDVRNRERLKHKGFMRDIQANLAVNAMEQESL